MSRLDYDVIVAGGGPAGSATAAWLARSGHRVLVLERLQFPRHHIGESLLAMSMPLLDDLGVARRIEESDFPRKIGSLFRWAGREYRLGMPHPGFAYQVTRARFDELLLDHARSLGVEVREHAYVRSADLDPKADPTSHPPEATTVAITNESGQPELLSCRYVVDASGLALTFARRLGLPIDMHGPKRAAIGAYFHGVDTPAAPHENSIVTEATRDGWLWFIPLRPAVASVGFVTNADEVQAEPRHVLEEQIQASVIVRRLVSRAGIEQGPSILRYTNHLVAAGLMGPRHVLVGDAAMFVDPLFSTGVHGALLTARAASAAVHSIVSGLVAPEAAWAWYAGQVTAHNERLRTMVRLLYGIHGGQSRFWSTLDLHEMSEDRARTYLRRLGVVGAAFFTEHRPLGLALPAALDRLMADVDAPVGRTSMIDERTPVSLAHGAEQAEVLCRAGDRLVSGLTTRRRDGLFAVTYPVGTYQEEAMRLLSRSGLRPVDLGRLLARRPTSGGQSAVDGTRLRHFLGTLVEAGILTTSSTRYGGEPA